MVGGAASVLTRRRATVLGALVVVLVAYEALARHLPSLPNGLDVAAQAVVVFPAFAALIWLALPLARRGSTILFTLAALAGALAVSFGLTGIDSAANVSKLAAYALAGFWFLTLFEELWWIALVAVLVPWVDIWSVATGPTEYVVEEKPGIFESVAVAFPSPGETSTLDIGPPDIVFFALFLAAADRFRLRVAATWIGMTALLGSTLVLVWAWDGVPGLPALPAVCLGFLLPNGDLLWSEVRRLRARTTELDG